MTRLALAILLVLSATAASAQIAFDFNLGPTVNWTEDVSAFRLDPTDPDFDPSAFLPDAFDSRNPSDTTGAAALGFLGRDDLAIPVTIGFQGGLGLTVRRGALGLRGGIEVLNTSAVYDFESRESFSDQSLQANFVTFQLDARLIQNVGPGRLYLFAGPEFRYLLDASEGFASVGEVREGLDFISTAATFGGGFKVDVFGTRFGPEFRYALDLTGVQGGDLTLDDGTVIRFDEAYDLDSFLVGIVFGGQ